MEKIVNINGKNYVLEKNENEGFNQEEVNNKITEFYDVYDYIVGDWAYGKLRLKGFYNENHKKVRDYNSIKYLEKYLNEYCAYGCKYFILKRVYKK